MKRYALLLGILALTLPACSGSQEIVEPSRDNFNTAPAEPRSIGDLPKNAD